MEGHRATNQTGGGARVEIDSDPDRCDTLTGPWLWLRIARRAAVGGVAAGACVGLLAATRWSAEAALPAGAGAALAWALVDAAVVAPLRLAQDLRAKQQVGPRYQCRVRYGGDAVQHRRLRIVDPPADLGARIIAALRELSPSARARRLDARRFEAVRPRRGLATPGVRLLVSLEEKTDGSVAAAVSCRPCGYRMPFATDPSVYTDAGRSIAHVEEFQLALRRLVERPRHR